MKKEGIIGLKIPLEPRLCNTCNHIEDENHIIMNCICFQTQREILFQEIIKVGVNWSTKDNKQQVQYIMAAKENNILYPITKYIKQIVYKRGNF